METQRHYIGMFESNGVVLAMVRDGEFLIAGDSTNAGMIERYIYHIDDCYSIDENLELFVSEIDSEEDNL